MNTAKYYVEFYTMNGAAKFKLLDENGKMIACSANRENVLNLIELKSDLIASFYSKVTKIGNYYLCENRIVLTAEQLAKVCNQFKRSK